jgi:TP901 family phage tail tape measure protein
MANKVIQILINAKDDASAVFLNLKNTVATVGAAIATYLGVSAFVGAVKGAANLEEGMDRVQAATGASKEEMAQLRQAAEGLEDFGGVEAALALENLGKAGLSATEAIAALKPAADLAKAGNIGLGEASEALTQVVFGLGLAFKDSARVADVLAGGANATKTSVGGLTQALSYAAPTAKALGLSLESTVALLGQFAQGGIDAGRAGTALNSIMSQFLDPASKFRAELGAAGISTDNFEKAIHQLAAAGPAGAKAINAVGLEAGPALRAMLNLGMGSLDELTAKLKTSEGEAARTAAVLRDNLNGSISSLGKAWEYLTNTLGTPVLPVIKDAVDQLAASFRSAVADGTVGKFGEAIATAFQAGIKWVREFLGTIDFVAVVAKLQEFAGQAGQFFEELGQKATNAGAIVQAAYGIMSTGVNSVLVAIYAIGSGFASTASVVMEGLVKLREGLAAITFGGLSKSFELAAEDARNAAEGFGDAAQAMRDKAKASLDAITKASEEARNGIVGLTTEVKKVAPPVKEAEDAFKGMAKGQDLARETTEILQRAIDAENASQVKATKSTRELRAEYEAAVATGNWQEATKVQEQLRKALQGAKTDANETALAVAAAFRSLGMKTTEDLNEVATKTAGAFDTLKKNGVTSTAVLRDAFTAMANAAMEAAERQGESAVRTARALLEAKASASGLKLEVTESGNVIVRSMRDAETATKNVGNAARGAAGGFQQMGQSAEAAAAATKKLQEIHDRNKVGNGSDLVGKSGDVREAAVLETDITQDIVKRYGEEFADSQLTRQAWALRQQLQNYQKNYGNVTRSQESLNQQRNIMAELARVEGLIEQERVKGEKARIEAEAKTVPTATQPTSSGEARPQRSGGVSSGMGTTVVFDMRGGRKSINTDPSGASVLQGVLAELTNGKGTSR